MVNQGINLRLSGIFIYQVECFDVKYLMPLTVDARAYLLRTDTTLAFGDVNSLQKKYNNNNNFTTTNINNNNNTRFFRNTSKILLLLQFRTYSTKKD